MFAFLFWLCVLGVSAWWVRSSVTWSEDDPLGQLLQAVPKVFAQPHLLSPSPSDESRPSSEARATRQPGSESATDVARDDAGAAAEPPERDLDTARAASVEVETRPPTGVSPGVASDVPPGATRRPLFDPPAERDDLKRISGIGPVMERHLNELGIASFAQLAAFDDEDVARVDAALENFHGRIVRDDWVGQARALVDDA